MDRRRILVVDDEASIRDVAGPSLELAGFRVRTEADGYAALAAVDAFAPDLMVIDVNMPGIDGFEVVRRVRAAGNAVPVVFLTARDSVDDSVAGFAAGADDYIRKPFHLKELIARVEAVLKRAGAAAPSTTRLRCGPIALDEAAHAVTRDGASVDLSPTEYRLLAYLLRNAGIVVSRAQILEHVWGSDETGDSVVDTFMSTLRRKVDHDETRVIHTIRGFGYVAREQP